MKRRCSGPPPAWANLCCSPDDLCTVLAALLAGRDQELAAWLASGQFPLAALTALVERHRLGCHLAGRLAHSPVAPRLPAELSASIQSRRQQQEQRSAAMLKELRRLLPRFREAGIPVMLLKGAELADRFHGGLFERGYGDLDLLVPGQERRASLDLLASLGYALRSRVLVSRSLMATVHHGFDFEREGVRLDLHWSLSRQPGYRIDESAVWARRVPWTHADVTIDVPAPQDELHLLLISAFADLQRGSLRLQSLLDLLAVLRALEPFDVEAFLRERGAEHTALVCRTMLEVARLLLTSSPQRVPGRDRILALLKPSPFQWRSKVWCARRLPVSLPHYALWWLASLPLRTAASHPALRSAPLAAALPGGQG
jgi:hypothetical protein